MPAYTIEDFVAKAIKTHDDAVARLQTVQRHDAMKNRWAAENGWRLIRLTGRAFLDDLRDAGVLPPTNRTHDLRRPPL